MTRNLVVFVVRDVRHPTACDGDHQSVIVAGAEAKVIMLACDWLRLTEVLPEELCMRSFVG